MDKIKRFSRQCRIEKETRIRKIKRTRKKNPNKTKIIVTTAQIWKHFF
jgi:hypothetical protein